MVFTCVKLELLGGTAFDFFEAFDKVARVVEAAAKGDLSDGKVGRRQHIGRLLDAIMGNIIDWCLLRERVEKSAEIVLVHSNELGKS